MTFFTKAQHEQLLANCQAQIVRMDNGQPDIDFNLSSSSSRPTPYAPGFSPNSGSTTSPSDFATSDWAHPS
jgi:hypothetical protein